ncbi:MAG: NUMOD3 domain-containing DNA-binding protein [Nanoarchaeota archaeon]
MSEYKILISGKYFLLESDNRFPIYLPTENWQNLTNKSFNSPNNCNIYLLSGHNNLYVGSDKDGSRPHEHKYTLETNSHCNQYMQRISNKYGLQIFYYQPLVEIPQEYVIYRDQIENSYIKLFDTYNNGYNLMEFADTPFLGRKHSEETKRKFSQQRMGNKYCLGKKCDENKKQKIRNKNKGKHRSKNTEFKKGIIPWNKGIPWSNEIKKKLSIANTGKKLSQETKVKISESLKNNHKNRKKVICLETNIIYDSIKDATKKLKLNFNHISDVCLGKRKISNGFHWKYLEKEKI